MLLAVMAWFGFKVLRDAKPADARGPGGGPPPSTVIFKPVEEKQAVERLRVTGTLRAARRAEVAAREPAAVEAIAVEEGDLVEEGAVLAVLDARRIEAQLASGGMGAVFIAEQLSTGHRRALKVLHPEHFEDEKSRARFAHAGGFAVAMLKNVTGLDLGSHTVKAVELSWTRFR